MSVIGIDIGNGSCVIAAAKLHGIDVLLNDEAKRDTPAVVTFGDKQRFFGSAGSAFATSNPKSTISQIKRLIGRLYNEPSVQQDLKLLPFVTSEGPRGGIQVELEYLNQKWKFTPVEILGMLFTHLKQVAEKNLKSPVVACVIGIPAYFTDLQRRLYLDAARISGLRPLRLMHDGTAIALGYGLYKNGFSAPGPTIVVFVDVGHCDTQVTVATFEQGGMKILSHSFDPNLGGRDFDEVLFTHFSEQFKEKYKIEVSSNPRASARLRASCEKVKKDLSVNAEARISIESLINDTDVRGVIKRAEFEKLSQELLDKFSASCITAVEDSGISSDKIYTIELVGSGSRIPAITDRLTSIFNKEPTRTLNASECVARGCALLCATLSPSHIVRDYKVEDVFPYPIAISLKVVKKGTREQVMLYQKGSTFPMSMKFKKTGSRGFYVDVLYTENKDFPAGVSSKVGNFSIGSSETSDLDKTKVEFEMKLNCHGIVEVESASVLEDKHYTQGGFQSNQGNSVGNSHTLNLEFSKNLDVATTDEELQEAQEREHMLAEQDKKVEETKDQRNNLESFVYDTRSKLSSDFSNFASDTEKKEISDRLQETEDWLYDDIDDESEKDYSGKLIVLKKSLNPIEKRFEEEKERARVKTDLQTCVEKYRSISDSSTPSLKEKILSECRTVEKWLNDLPPHEPSLIQIPLIIKATQTFEWGCEKIIRSESEYIEQHAEFVNSNQRDRSMESYQRGESEDFEHWDQYTDSSEKGQCLNYNQRDWSVHSDQKSQIVYSTKKGQSTGLSRKGQPTGLARKSNLTYSSQKLRPTDSSQKLRATDSARRVQPTDSSQNVQPSPLTVLKSHIGNLNPFKNKSPNSTALNCHSANSSAGKGQPCDSTRNKQRGDSPHKGYPTDSPQKGYPTDSPHQGCPADLAQIGQHKDLARKGQPGDSDQNDQLVGSVLREQLEDMQVD